MSLLRPQQVAEFQQTIHSLEKKLRNDHIQDKAAVRKQLKNASQCLESQRPVAPEGIEADRIAKRQKELLEEIKVGMPSHEEMRKAPPGAVGKHMQWENRNAAKIEEWKNNQLRLHAGTDDVDIANLEIHRPTASTLNMENAFIPGQNFHIPDNVQVAQPFSDDDIKLIKARAPVEVWAKLPTLDAEARRLLKQMYIDTWDPATDEVQERPGVRKKPVTRKSPRS